MAASAIIDRGMVAKLLHTQAATTTTLTVVGRRQPDPDVNAWVRSLGLQITREARVRGSDESDNADFTARYQVVAGPGLANAWALDTAVALFIAAMNEQTMRDVSTTHQVDIQTVDDSADSTFDGEAKLEAQEVVITGKCSRTSGVTVTDFLT